MLALVDEGKTIRTNKAPNFWNFTRGRVPHAAMPPACLQLFLGGATASMKKEVHSLSADLAVEGGFAHLVHRWQPYYG